MQRVSHQQTLSRESISSFALEDGRLFVGALLPYGVRAIWKEPPRKSNKKKTIILSRTFDDAIFSLEIGRACDRLGPPNLSFSRIQSFANSEVVVQDQ